MESKRLWDFSSFLCSEALSRVADRSLWLSIRSRNDSACLFWLWVLIRASGEYMQACTVAYLIDCG